MINIRDLMQKTASAAGGIPSATDARPVRATASPLLGSPSGLAFNLSVDSNKDITEKGNAIQLVSTQDLIAAATKQINDLQLLGMQLGNALAGKSNITSAPDAGAKK